MTVFFIQLPDDSRLDLTPGTHRIGRSADNEISLDDGSVSSFHGEMVVEEEAVHFRDLGSTNGSFLDGHPVRDEVIPTGGILRIGNVDLRLAKEERTASGGVRRLKVARDHAAAAEPLASSAVQESVDAQPANDLACDRCQVEMTFAWAKSTKVRGAVLYFCSRCGGRARLLAEAGQTQAPPVKLTFFQSLMAAFKYPLTPAGLMILGAGTVFFAALYGAGFVASFAGIIGFLAFWIVTVFGGGYLFSFAKSIVVSTANGEDEAPDWPEFTDMGSDIIGPFLQAVGLFLVCFGPAVGMLMFLPEGINLLVGGGFALLGIFYLPMGFVAVSMFDTLASLNPVLIINSIVRILGRYLVVCLFLGGVLVARHLALMAADEVGIPILPFVVAEFVGLYFLIVITRVLGVMYYQSRDRLKWF